MGVRLEGESGIAVTEVFGDSTNVDASGEPSRGGGVAQDMHPIDARVGRSGGCSCGLPGVAEALPVVGPAIGTDEQERRRMWDAIRRFPGEGDSRGFVVGNLP